MQIKLSPDDLKQIIKQHLVTSGVAANADMTFVFKTKRKQGGSSVEITIGEQPAKIARILQPIEAPVAQEVAEVPAEALPAVEEAVITTAAPVASLFS